MFKFYGFQSLKKFKKIQELHFFKTRLRMNCLFFENYLCVFVLRTNFGLTMHFSKTGILYSFFAVNKEIITNPFFKFKLGDDIYVNKHKFQMLYPRIFDHFKDKKAIINMPGYIYFNYSSCIGSIWRLPHKYEVCGPIDFNIRQGAYTYSYSGSYFK